MKKPTVLLPLVLAGLAFAGTNASTAYARGYCGPRLWPEVKKLARTCLATERAGRPCRGIRVYGGRSAAFYLGNDLYRVRIEESEFSDGGDLDDVYIVRDDGCQLERRNVPAFGDVLRALAR